MRFKVRWVPAVLLAMGLAMPSPAATPARDPNLDDTTQPGSVIIFPKFINDTPVTTSGDLAVLPRTEIEIGVVCPKGSTCTEHQAVKIRFHWVCPGSDDIFFKFICQETDFDINVTVNGKLAFSADGTPIGGSFTAANSPRAPKPPCRTGFLIGWVINSADQPIKFDGLIGDAVLRGPAVSPALGSSAVEAYRGITIQARLNADTGAVLTSDEPGELAFDGTQYLGLPRTLFGDVKFDKETAGPPGPIGALNQTYLVLMTLDVDSNFPNL